MKIVHSFWSKPIVMRDNSDAIFRDKGGWSNKLHYYMSWALSCLKFKELYGRIELVTDKYGKELLCDTLELPYTSVKVELDCLNEYNHHLWALGKLYAYSIQEEPFLHVDSDVYIWKKFPQKLLFSDLIAQNWEINYDVNAKFYQKLQNEFIFFPECIKDKEFPKVGEIFQANAGILGGNDIGFIKEYTQNAFDFIDKNQDNFEKLSSQKGMFNMVYEQYLFYQLAESKGKNITYLLNKVEDNFAGLADFHMLTYYQYYIHALGTYKKFQRIGVCVAERLFIEYPDYYYRIINLFNKNVL